MCASPSDFLCLLRKKALTLSARLVNSAGTVLPFSNENAALDELCVCVNAPAVFAVFAVTFSQVNCHCHCN